MARFDLCADAYVFPCGAAERVTRPTGTSNARGAVRSGGGTATGTGEHKIPGNGKSVGDDEAAQVSVCVRKVV